MATGFTKRVERQIAQVDLGAQMLTLDGQLQAVKLLDLSHNGCRVGEVPMALERDAPVALKLPGLSEFIFGRIVWHRGETSGIAFVEPLFEPVFRYLKDKLFGLDAAA